MFGNYLYKLIIVILAGTPNDSTLLKVALSKDAHDFIAGEINSDLDALVCWGKKWHIEFEPAKLSALCI